MDASEIIRLPDLREKVRIELKEVVQDTEGKPTLFVRLKLTGWYFPQRALLPFVLVGDLVSRFVTIAPDSKSATAYFDRTPPDAAQVTFGYGNIVSWDFPVAVRTTAIERLDRQKLPKGTTELK